MSKNEITEPKKVNVYENGKKKKQTTNTITKIKLDRQLNEKEAQLFLLNALNNRRLLKKVKVS